MGNASWFQVRDLTYSTWFCPLFTLITLSASCLLLPRNTLEETLCFLEYRNCEPGAQSVGSMEEIVV